MWRFAAAVLLHYKSLFSGLTRTQRHAGAKLEGNVFNMDPTLTDFTRTPQIHAYIDEFRRVDPDVVCETGFNGGHSALLWIALKSSAKVVSFDICSDVRCRVGIQYIKKHYPSADVTIIEGDSRKTVPTFALRHPTFECDLIVVDGGHIGNVPFEDLKNLARLAKRTTTVLIDDVNITSSAEYLRVVGAAWQRAKQLGIVRETKCGPCYSDPARECGYCSGTIPV